MKHNIIVELGAASLTGKDANELIANAFADASYPLRLHVSNHMPRDVVFPEVDGLFLRHVANHAESQKSVTISSYDLLQRVTTSVAQVAELNGYAHALTLTLISGHGLVKKGKNHATTASGATDAVASSNSAAAANTSQDSQ